MFEKIALKGKAQPVVAWYSRATNEQSSNHSFPAVRRLQFQRKPHVAANC